MKEFDFQNIDGKILRTFLTVLEESSVSRAASRLGVTQSGVSHSLAKLRMLLSDPLFVRSGQGLTPTERAVALRGPVQTVLDGMKSLTDERPFDAQAETIRVRIACNDMPREVLFPPLLGKVRAEGIDLRLEFLTSGVPDTALLRTDRCQLLLTPLPPDGPDIFQKLLLNSPQMIFFDATQGSPPSDWDSYCRAEHVDVRFEDGQSARLALRGVETHLINPPVITLPHFNAVPAFLRGSRLIATESGLMRRGAFGGLDCVPLPFDCPTVPIYMVWHERSNADPAHKWLRRQIEGTVQDLRD